MLRLFVLACVFLYAVPADAQTAKPTPTPTPQQPVSSKERKTCKVEVATGSIMPKRVCHTDAEWEASDAADRNGVDTLRTFERSHPSLPPMPGG
jgi:hypothetical protein